MLRLARTSTFVMTSQTGFVPGARLAAALLLSLLLGPFIGGEAQAETIVGPTGDEGFVVTIDEPGTQNIFYENRGTLGDQLFDTPRRQVWTTFETPSMTCTVTRVDTGEAVEVRMPGKEDEPEKSRTSKDLVYTYNFMGRQGHGAWVFDADKPGDYRITLAYKDAIAKPAEDFQIPPELTREDKKQMTQAAGDAYEAERRDLIEQAALASLEPIDVLFAVGPDPTRGGYFNVIGLKGAATILAFGFTSSVDEDFFNAGFAQGGDLGKPWLQGWGRSSSTPC